VSQKIIFMLLRQNKKIEFLGLVNFLNLYYGSCAHEIIEFGFAMCRRPSTWRSHGFACAPDLAHGEFKASLCVLDLAHGEVSILTLTVRSPLFTVMGLAITVGLATAVRRLGLAMSHALVP